MAKLLQHFLQERVLKGEIRYVDAEFSKLMYRHAGGFTSAIADLIADLSYSLSLQHSCLDISKVKKEVLAELHTLSIVSDSAEQEITPLILRGRKLYLHRYYQYEKKIAEALISRNTLLDTKSDFSAELQSTFGETSATKPSQTIDWQQLAIMQALTRRLTIITGGPGTGKTSTVVRILAILLGDNSGHALSIKLAAPTGKAAMRLSASISDFLPNIPEPVRAKIPTEVHTIHRLLGMRNNGRTYRYNSDNPIVTDLLIVDEVSMVDLTLMHHLLDALMPSTRLILLGDPEQLPSVDVGKVLADICLSSSGVSPGYSAEFSIQAKKLLGVDVPVRSEPHKLVDSICHLQKNYRFAQYQGIGQLANLIRSGDAQLESSVDDEVRVLNISALSPAKLSREISSYFFEYEMLIRDTDIDALTLIHSFEQTRILCPLRDGDLGIETLNKEIESYLESKDLKPSAQAFYHGRPILITRNDYGLGLFNGDVGICIIEEDGFKVAFLNNAGDLNYYYASQLPAHETCFAMTVHKSQGSEFNHVTLIVPALNTAASEQLLTRELVYTAVTRARDSIAIYVDSETWEQALTRSVSRSSGLSSFFNTDIAKKGLTKTAQAGVEQLGLF
ncbi:MAG: exodeoxyribonuclease V subunit alpha [Pseudomonadales bacterium]|jgi:exodeoxyribonuclease V alpha subunit